MKSTIQEIIERYENLLAKRNEEVKRLEYLWNVKEVSSEFTGQLSEINNEIQEFLGTELEIK